MTHDPILGDGAQRSRRHGFRLHPHGVEVVLRSGMCMPMP